MTWKLHKSALIMQIQIPYYVKFCLRVRDHPHPSFLSLPSIHVSVRVRCVLCPVRAGRAGAWLHWLLAAAPRPDPPCPAATAQNTTDLGLSHNGRQRNAHRSIQLALFANIFFAICQNAQKAHFYEVSYSINALYSPLQPHKHQRDLAH